MRKLLASLLVLAAIAPAPAMAHDGPDIATARKINFPKLKDGRSVLAVDLHTHSVFSDGMVWPSVRVEEAKRDGLFALAVSEHLEYQPKSADIPHPDRNRSYQVAAEAAKVKPDATGVDMQPLIVINGSEITKLVIQPGHMNAVFITDANALLPKPGLNPADASREQLKVANAQGGFTFWNHPYWTSQTPNGVATLDPLHAEFIKSGLLHGIEVANGADMSDEAFKIALDNNLTILGTSDIHGLIDWDYDLEHGGHRTATLVLTKNETADGLKAALKAGDTVAIYNDNLIGKKANVEAVVRGTLKLEVGEALPRTTVQGVSIINDSPVDYMLENLGPEGAYDEGHVITVKSGSTFTILIKNVPDPKKLSLNFKVLNTYVAPREHLVLNLKDETP
ncbi:MAG: Sb-PDE family phosphodiesterase [Hyphomonadaceae bacterium]